MFKYFKKLARKALMEALTDELPQIVEDIAAEVMAGEDIERVNQLDSYVTQQLTGMSWITETVKAHLLELNTEVAKTNADQAHTNYELVEQVNKVNDNIESLNESFYRLLKRVDREIPLDKPKAAE